MIFRAHNHVIAFLLKIITFSKKKISPLTLVLVERNKGNPFFLHMNTDETVILPYRMNASKQGCVCVCSYLPFYNKYLVDFLPREKWKIYSFDVNDDHHILSFFCRLCVIYMCMYLCKWARLSFFWLLINGTVGSRVDHSTLEKMIKISSVNYFKMNLMWMEVMFSKKAAAFHVFSSQQIVNGDKGNAQIYVYFFFDVLFLF